MTSNNVHDNTITFAKVLIRDGNYIHIQEDFNWYVPEILDRGGMRGVHSPWDEVTYLYSVRQNIMTGLRDGRIIEEWTPDRKLSYWSMMDEYLKL